MLTESAQLLNNSIVRFHVILQKIHAFRFPSLQDGMKTFLGTEMDRMLVEEKFLKEEPERLESALRRCKKLTGTLVTLKRLVNVILAT